MGPRVVGDVGAVRCLEFVMTVLGAVIWLWCVDCLGLLLCNVMVRLLGRV